MMDKVKFASLLDELKKITRRQDEIQKTLDLLYADREILEDIQGSIRHLQEIILANQQHQDSAHKDVKENVKAVEFAVQDKVDEVKTSINDKTIIVKSPNENIFTKLKNKLARKK